MTNEEIWNIGLEERTDKLSKLQSEYDTVAAYSDFLAGVQPTASQLSGISIFQNDRTGYDMKNIELTAQVYAGLTETPIDYYPQKGLYTAISSHFQRTKSFFRCHFSLSV